VSIDDLWYKNAVIYRLDVEKYQDANGDGIGDTDTMTLHNFSNHEQTTPSHVRALCVAMVPGGST